MVDTRTAAEKAAAHKAQVEGSRFGDPEVAKLTATKPVLPYPKVRENSLAQRLNTEALETGGKIKEGSLAQAFSAEQLALERLEKLRGDVGDILWYILRGVFTTAQLEVLLNRASTVVKTAALKRAADKEAKVKATEVIEGEPKAPSNDEEVLDRYLSDQIIYATKSTNRP